MNRGTNVITFQKPSVIRAKSYKVSSGNQNYAQYVNTIKAYALAGMPFEHIANAGELIGDQVEKGEIDTSLIEGWQEKAGEIAEEESKVLAWQNRGDVISITNQIASPNPVTENEIMAASQDLTTGQNQPQDINVLEGIAVFNQDPNKLSNQQKESQIENNPYLRAPADLNKPI